MQHWIERGIFERICGLLIEECDELGGGPLAAIVAPANRHDTKLLDATLKAIVIERPEPTEAKQPAEVVGVGFIALVGIAAQKLIFARIADEHLST